MDFDSNIRVAHHCPFCGGPVILEKEEIIAQCGNCGSMLRLIPPEGIESYIIDSDLARREAIFFLERELKRNKQPLIKKRGEIFQLHLPFYRVIGKVFDFQRRIEEYKNVSDDGREYVSRIENQDSRLRQKEMSFASFDSTVFGLDSLGVRTQILQLSPLTPRHARNKIFLRPAFNLDYALTRYEKSIDSIYTGMGKKAKQRFSKALCPAVCIVYLPVWVINYSNDLGLMYAVIDCASERIVKNEKGELGKNSEDYDESVEGTVFKLVAHRCNNCGFDLPHQKKGEIFACGNCGRHYHARGEKYEDRIINLPRGEFAGSGLFPFWMFRLAKTDSSTILKSKLGMNSSTVFIPAFEIRNLKRAARLSLSLSNAIDEIDFDKCERSDYNFRAANLGFRDASGLVLPYLLAGRDNLGHLNLEELWRLYLEFDEKCLVWLPFYEEGYFYRGHMAGQGFEKAALVT